MIFEFSCRFDDRDIRVNIVARRGGATSVRNMIQKEGKKKNETQRDLFAPTSQCPWCETCSSRDGAKRTREGLEVSHHRRGSCGNDGSKQKETYASILGLNVLGP